MNSREMPGLESRCTFPAFGMVMLGVAATLLARLRRLGCADRDADR